MTNENMNFEQDIPIFFSVGDKFCHICSVALLSLMENSNPRNHYSIYILHSGMNDTNRQKLQSMLFPNTSLEFVDVTEKLKGLEDKFVVRDYYNNYTYYRLFIPTFFPNLDKALYIDSDIVVLDDIAKLFNTEMGDNLVAAAPDGAVRNTPIFQIYVEKALGVDRNKYFNAGILLMNLKAMREFDFENKFLTLCEKFKFRVAQDQDYLNVLCKNRVTILPFDWDMMPIPNTVCKYDKLKIIHYNLMFKPWDMHGVDFENYFWKYAEKSPFYSQIDEARKNISPDAALGPVKLLEGMTQLINDELSNPNNYNRTHEKLFLDDEA